MADGMPQVSEVKGVHRAIHAVMKGCLARGLGKNGYNSHQKFNFRSIDDAYALLSELLVEHDLIITPYMTDIKSEIVATKNSKGYPTNTNYVTVTVEYRFVCVTDGSERVVKSPGEAFDTGDKATSKAMSMAYKAMAFQAFHIPLEGQRTPDADRDTYERDIDPPQQPTQQPAPQTLTKANARPEYKAMVDEICAFGSTEKLKDWGKRNVERVNLLPPDWKIELRKEYSAKLDEIRQAEEADRYHADLPVS